jgi:hypothetical protein
MCYIVVIFTFHQTTDLSSVTYYVSSHAIILSYDTMTHADDTLHIAQRCVIY